MLLNEKTITLKNGKTAVFKTPDFGEGTQLLNFIQTSCGETEFLLRYPEEWAGATVESEEKWIKNVRESKNCLTIACYIDGEVAGNCSITFLGAMKMKHRATIGIAILQKYWGLGIGSALFKEMLAAAEAHEGTEIIELEFIEGNHRAQALYEKFGFQIVCERPNALKLKDGSMRKEIFMQKIL